MSEQPAPKQPTLIELIYDEPGVIGIRHEVCLPQAVIVNAPPPAPQQIQMSEKQDPKSYECSAMIYNGFAAEDCLRAADEDRADGKEPLRGIYLGRHRDRFINPLNGRAVWAQLQPNGEKIYSCYDGEPYDPLDGGRSPYNPVHRGVVEDLADAELWLRGKWPEHLIFVEGVSTPPTG